MKCMNFILREVTDGFGKLEKEEYWLSNSHPISVILFGLATLSLGCIMLPTHIVLKIKWAIKGKLKRRTMRRDYD